MIPSMSPGQEQQQLRDYLLGRMSEEGASRLDERLFESNVLVEQLSNERQSLMEEFVGGHLPAEELTLFQSQLSKSPELQREVADLSHLLSALQKDVAVSSRRDKSALLRFFFLLSPALAILLFVVSLFYVQERHRSAELHSQLQAAQQGTEPVVQASADRQPMVTLFLSANVFRGTSGPPEITIPAHTSILELQVELHSSAADKDWNVELLAGQQIVLQSPHTHLRQAGQEVFLTVLADTRDLPAGTYAVRYAPASNLGAVQTRFFVIRQGR